MGIRLGVNEYGAFLVFDPENDGLMTLGTTDGLECLKDTYLYLDIALMARHDSEIKLSTDCLNRVAEHIGFTYAQTSWDATRKGGELLRAAIDFMYLYAKRANERDRQEVPDDVCKSLSKIVNHVREGVEHIYSCMEGCQRRYLDAVSLLRGLASYLYKSATDGVPSCEAVEDVAAIMKAVLLTDSRDLDAVVRACSNIMG